MSASCANSRLVISLYRWHYCGAVSVAKLNDIPFARYPPREFADHQQRIGRSFVIVTCPNHPTPSRNPSEYRLGRSARESLSGVLSAGLEQEKTILVIPITQ